MRPNRVVVIRMTPALLASSLATARCLGLLSRVTASPYDELPFVPPKESAGRAARVKKNRLAKTSGCHSFC